MYNDNEKLKDKNITLEDILTDKHNSWDYYELSQHSNFCPEWLKKIPDVPGNYRSISHNKNLTLEWIKFKPDADWDYDAIGSNIYLDFSWVEAFPNIPWNFHLITPKVKDIYKWLKFFPDANWDYRTIAMRNNLSLEIIKLIPKEKLNFEILSESYYFKIEWLEAFPNANWNFTKLSRNVNLSLEWLDKFPQAPWCFRKSVWDKLKYSKNNRGGYIPNHQKSVINTIYTFYEAALRQKPDKIYFKKEWLLKHKNIDWDFKIINSMFIFRLDTLIKLKDLPWDFKILSAQNYINIEYLRAFPNANWDFQKLSEHNSLELSWLELFPNAVWNFKDITKCCNFDISWIEKFPHSDWDLEYLSNRKGSHICIFYQYHNPKKAILKTFSPESISNLKLKLIPLILLNQENKKYIRYDIKCLGYWETEKLTDKERDIIFQLYQFKYKFYGFYPDIIHNIMTPLSLQDLSGEIFEVESWFQSDDLIGLIHQKYPSLKSCEIIISQTEKEYDLYASNFSNDKIKNALLKLQDGPEAMIIYND